MTAQINPNVITNINNPFTGKILFYTKKSAAGVWHENLELYNYAKRLLRFFKLKKHLPGDGLKIKRTSLNNIYIFNFLPKHTKQPNKMLKFLTNMRNSLQKQGNHKLQRASAYKGFRMKKSKNKIKKIKQPLILLQKKLKKKNKQIKNFKQPFQDVKESKILPYLIKNGFFFKPITNFNKHFLCLRRKKYFKSYLFTQIKNLIIKKFAKKIKKNEFFFNHLKKNETIFWHWLKTEVLNHLNTEHLLNKDLSNNFTKKMSYNRKLRSFDGLFFKNQKKKKIKTAFYDKTKSKFYKRINKYRSDNRSFSYLNLIQSSFLNLFNFNHKKNFKIKNVLKSQNRFKNLTKHFQSIFENKEKNNLLTNSLLLFQNNSAFLSNKIINKTFLYKLLIEERLQLQDKVALFENECSFTLNIFFSSFKLIYQKFINLMPKVTQSFGNLINEEDLPNTRTNYSKLYINLNESLRTQNLEHIESGLNRFLRRQNTRRLYQASGDVIQAVKKILQEQFFWNLFIFTRYGTAQPKSFLEFLFSQPFDVTLKIPQTFTLKYRGKLKKAGRKQRSSFFHKNALASDNLKLFKAAKIPVDKLKYETISSRFGAHFKRGGTGGFNLSVTYVYPHKTF